jgi:flagellar FliL protein
MADHGASAAEGRQKPAKKKGKLLLIAIPVLLIAGGAGGWVSGIIPSLLGAKPKTGNIDPSAPPVAAATPPIYVDVPEFIANLNVSGKRPSYLKLHAKLEISAKSDEASVAAAMPRIQDLFQTYLRDMRPDELRGSEGSYRLREELIDRASTAAAPAHITDVLFIEMVVE